MPANTNSTTSSWWASSPYYAYYDTTKYYYQPPPAATAMSYWASHPSPKEDQFQTGMTDQEFDEAVHDLLFGG